MEQDNISISWKHLPWKKFQRKSFRLQCKIYEAKCCDSSRNVKRLQKLLIKSKSIYYLAVKKVTDYYYRKGLFLSSEIKLSLVYEIYSNIINWKYFLLESYVKKGFLSIKILKAKIVSSILEFLIDPFFLHFFYQNTARVLLKHGKYLAMCGHVAACAERVHSGREGRAGYVAASESVSSSFCAVLLEKILNGFLDRPNTPELCRSSAWTAAHDLGLLFVRQHSSDGGENSA
jgi:hypothetical protein